jgi:dihydrofolate reductase
MKIGIIAAVAENQAIGKDNDLIWHLPDDLQFFKEKTLNTTIITGRKNYESIPEKFRPLPKRQNIVVTRNGKYEAPGSIVAHSVEEALEKAPKDRETYIIGGSQIYKVALEKNLVDFMYITAVHGSFDADVYFPEIDEGNWEIETLSEHPKDEKHDYGFIIKKYLKK